MRAFVVSGGDAPMWSPLRTQPLDHLLDAASVSTIFSWKRLHVRPGPDLNPRMSGLGAPPGPSTIGG